MHQEVIAMFWSEKLYPVFKKNPTSKLRLVYLYRSISLFLTSFFYFLGPQSPFLFKLGVVLSLGIAAWIIGDLQRKYIDNTKILKSIVITETIVLTLLLIPTGGISSPFIWYTLNPVIIAASFLTPVFCWSLVTFYLGSATLIAYKLFNVNNMILIIEESSFIYLVCLLITLLARLFSDLTKELDSKANLFKMQQIELLDVNKKLVGTNKKYQQTIEHIMSLYHIMDNFSYKKGSKKLIQEISTSLMKCTQSESAFFWVTDLQRRNSQMASTINDPELETKLKEQWNNIKNRRAPFVGEVNKQLYWMKIIRTSNNLGILGVKILNDDEEKKPLLFNRTFEFVCELSEIMLERIYMDQMMDQMVIVEEQNRIANEIHDSVSQRLFGIVYSLHSLPIKSKNLSQEELNKEFLFLSKSANAAMKELRAAIYRLSSIKKGEQPFFLRLTNYLNEYAKLNDIKIDYEVNGDEFLIEAKLKEALYRIICETCGNAVRHGDCTLITVKLLVVEKEITLSIQDNGNGMKIDNHKVVNETGIGLKNIKNIVTSYSGHLSINDVNGFGTEIYIEIPIQKIINKQEAVG